MNSDFSDLLSSLSEAGAQFLIVGGYAVMEYAEPKYTKDLDIWIRADVDNAQRVYRGLASFGAPVGALRVADLCEPEIFVQIGVAPVRVDILTTVPGLEFHAAWERRVERTLDGVPVGYLCMEDLITSKIAAGRKQDRQDVRALTRVRKRRQE